MFVWVRKDLTSRPKILIAITECLFDQRPSAPHLQSDTTKQSFTRGAHVMIMLWICWKAIMLGAARVATDRDRTPHEKEPM
jgi:hypothetical protein